MNDNSCDSENEMQVEECSGGRKSKSKIKKGVGQSKKRTIISNKEQSWDGSFALLFKS